MLIREYSNALKFPVNYYRPIGEFIFRWAQLEYQMHEIIWRAMGIDNPQGRTLTIGMNARNLCAIIGTCTLRWISDPAEQKIARSITKGVRDLNDFRNQLAHGSWQYPKKGKRSDVHLHYMKETPQRIMPKAIPHQPEEIEDEVKKLRSLNEKAQNLIFRLDAKHKP